MLDSDGYPTEEALEWIRSYSNFENPYEMADFLKSMWHWRDYIVQRGRSLVLHTGGWSGNESLIRALQDTMWWHLYWQKSTRGGHYWIKLPAMDKAKK
jgi:hypothetical protein